MSEINDAMARSVQWLVREQHASGGWAQQHGMQANSLNTAEALIALLDVSDDLILRGSEPIRKGVSYLVGNQYDIASSTACWVRVVHRENGSIMYAPDIIRTAFAIQALIKSGHGVDEPVIAKAVNWLLSIRRPSGMWGFGAAADSDSDFLPTCISSMALLDACGAAPRSMQDAYGYDDCVLPAVRAVLDRQQADGCIGQDTRLAAAHTIYAVLLLQKVRRCGKPAFLDQERRALDWLLQHQDAANKLVEEQVILSPEQPDANYYFLYMTDTLLARALSAATDQRHCESKLVTDTLIGIKDRLDLNGGAFGSRIFSWSTAKTTTALAVVARSHRDFPKREPEIPGLRVGPILVGFATLLALAVIVLSITGDFGPIQSVVLMFLMLAALLAYGRIGEQTFSKIVLRLSAQGGK